MRRSWRRSLVLSAFVSAIVLVLAACGGATATPVPAIATPRPTSTNVAATPTPPPVAATTAAPTATRAPGTTATAVPPTATVAAVATATPVATPTRAPPTATPAGPAPKYGGTYRMRRIQDFADLDVRLSTGQFSVIWTRNMLNNLITYQPDDTGKVLPDLAERWNVSGDGATWTFNVRKGVTWQDGKPFTSADVRFTLESYRNPEIPGATINKTRLAAVAGVQAPSDDTVVVTLSRPSASFLGAMASPPVVVYPAHVPYSSDDYKKKPIGTGAYTFKSHESGSVTRLAKNPNYWGKDAAGRALPYMDQLEYYTIVDQTTVRGAFLAGRLDCLCGYGSDILITDLPIVLKQVPDLKYYIQKASTLVTLQLNSRPPFNNRVVRQAVNFGIDREEANRTFLDGNGYFPPGLMLPPASGGQWGLTDDELLATPGFRRPKDQDLTLAKQLLQQSGVDPSKFKLTILSSTRFEGLATVVDASLAKLGFQRSNIAIRDLGSATADLMAGSFDFNIAQLSYTIDDPGDQLAQTILTGGANNWGKWSYPDLDQLSTEQDRTLDVAKRKGMIHDMQRKALSEAIQIPLVDQLAVYATAPYVMDFPIKRALSVSPAHRLEKVWLDK